VARRRGRARRNRTRDGQRQRGSDVEFSCGGVVVRDGQCVVIVPVRPDGRRITTLPKGHPEEGEDPATAAVREIREETGVHARVVARLGDVVYWYQREGRRIRKTVRFYLCAHEAGEPDPDGVEVRDARWMPLDRAVRELAFPGDRQMAAQALERTTDDH